MANPSFTQALTTKILASAHTPFRQLIQDDLYYDAAHALAITGGTPVRLEINGGAINEINAADHLASGTGNGWDTTDDKAVFPDELDGPNYNGEVYFTFDPPSAGSGIIRLYIDETVPVLIRAYPFDYPSVVQQVIVPTKFYLGDAVGGDAKNNGVYWTIEFDDSGDLWGTGIILTR